jgi:hypothetical protein
VYAAFLLASLLAADPAPSRYFTITVVDDQTGRGVPLVELRTVNNLRFVTDSAGVVALDEPDLMGQTVFFSVHSHGYEFPKDGFGFAGKALKVTPGGSARLSIKRLNVAERLYRVTGGGVYRDSVLAGRPVPVRHPLLNGQVLGSDSVVNALYRGKLYWFWGDTNRPGYPLGNFHASGATSRLPADGGLDPETGVDLDYFTDESGFARPMAPMPGEGPTWLSGPVVLRDRAGRERMFAPYVKVRNQLDVYEHGLAEFSDERERFEKVVTFPEGAPAYPSGHPFRHTDGGVEFVYFATPYPLVRVRAEPEQLSDLRNYEVFTCLLPSGGDGKPRIDRGDDGAVRYSWRKGAPPLTPTEQARLVKTGVLRAGERLQALRDADTGETVLAHAGSVSWNAFRRRWVMITVQTMGRSFLGEVWYAEADTPLGPWVYARKVVTHDRYSFYNPKQHPYFDKENGRVIFFEGTYSATFSGNPDPTPRYDYNQVMYKLDLADPRLVLPVPVYAAGEPGRPPRYATAPDLPRSQSHPVVFYALDRPRPGTVPVYAGGADGSGTLTIGAPTTTGKRPVFYALPHDVKAPPVTAVPLFEYLRESDGARSYSADAGASKPGYQRSRKPLCLVWRNPLTLPLP